jgi:hypothetical protein
MYIRLPCISFENLITCLQSFLKEAFQDIHTNPIPLLPPPGMGLVSCFWGVFVLSCHDWKNPAKSSAFCMRVMMVTMMVHERFECVVHARDFIGGLIPGCDHRQ